MTENLDAYKDAYTTRFPYHHDEELLLRAYSGKIVARLRDHRAIRLLSLGIGGQTVSSTLRSKLDVAEYHIVEGSGEIIAAYREATSPPGNVIIHHDRFETFAPGGRFDAIEMGFVLEHVDDPAQILRRYRDFLEPGGILFTAVPNARSLHRLLGHAAGLLDDLYALSPSDLELGHKRYFDAQTFERTVTEAGYAVVERHGLVLKPLATAQLQSLDLSPAIERAFIDTGYPLPDICNGIMLTATLE
jgi:2-polyprenyl-3-methyl-5-hydroxy-6-metoxy-1,4-benzoquinol methylase